MSERREDTDFLLREYEQCWAYIKFHYEQRDRSQRFFFTFVIGAFGLGTALWRIEPNFPLEYLLFLIIPLVLLGFFTLNQMVMIRRTTTFFHKTIVTIRAQLIGRYKTPLWLSDIDPKFYSRGFNLYTVLIVITVTAAVAALGVLIALFEWGYSVWYSVSWFLLAAVVGVLGQWLWYRQALNAEDEKYRPLFNDRNSGET